MNSHRTHFIGRLRVVLTVLVILHHTAITYGGSGGWFYREVHDEAAPSSLLLTVFCAVNQSFFMGMFFLLAGYFTPASLQRKGPGRFLRERLVRLGIPLLAFGLLLGPLAVAFGRVPAGAHPWETWTRLLSSGTFVIGPLWFAWALLIFAAAFVAWRRVKPPPAPADPRPVPPSSTWLVAALAVGGAALAVRQIVPVGESVLGLQLGYFASYVFLFALGCTAASQRWLERVAPQQARRWGVVSLVTIPTLFVVAAFAGALEGRPVDFGGGLGWPAIAYAFWEPFVAWGIMAVLLVVFQRRFNQSSAAWQRWESRAYGAFILHAPILVGLSVALAGWDAPALVKFVLVGAAAVATSFAAAGLLLRIPGASRVL